MTHRRAQPVSLHEGDYLTDRRRLFRVLQIVPTTLTKQAAILEDCRTLDAILFRPGELARMQLEVVRQAPVGAPSAPGRPSVT
jgi:hypothetical protein